MKINNIYRKLVPAVVALFTATMTSCTDFLTIIPPEKVVHEHFWQTKDDVNGILATSYLKLLSTDAVGKAIVWGELRADNLTYTPSTGNSNELRYIVEANILPENSYAKWGVYYEAIANANLVLEYAPQVVERDPDFTKGDLDVVMGEMYAMRALCHFYLVRTFRDIPMSMVVSANDADLPDYEQVHPLEALRLIMEDLERAENMVMISGNFPSVRDNYGRITKNAVLAMKADVSLWQAAFATYYEGDSKLVKPGDVEKYYNACIENCNAVLSNMETLYLKKYALDNMPVGNPYFLEENKGTAEGIKYGTTYSQYYSTAYESIFGSRNSVESIFEHHIDGNLVEDDNYGKGIYNMYGLKLNPGGGQLCIPKSFATFYDSRRAMTPDLRLYSYTNAFDEDNASDTERKTYYAVAKYTAAASNASEPRQDNSRNANWIVYRKTDVMLMMAEAYAVRPGATAEDFKKAYNLVKAVNFRSRVGYIDENRNDIERPDIEGFAAKKDIAESNYMTKETCLQLVLDERLRELAFEGKRWYDLVRKALREKKTDNITFVADKLGSIAGVVKTKMSSIDGLFFPIHIDEIRFNKKLEQNPAYATESSSSEMVK